MENTMKARSADYRTADQKGMKGPGTVPVEDDNIKGPGTVTVEDIKGPGTVFVEG